jgi:hypothetical protein
MSMAETSSYGKVYGNTKFRNYHNNLSLREVHGGLRFEGRPVIMIRIFDFYKK